MFPWLVPMDRGSIFAAFPVSPRHCGGILNTADDETPDIAPEAEFRTALRPAENLIRHEKRVPAATGSNKSLFFTALLQINLNFVPIASIKCRVLSRLPPPEGYGFHTIASQFPRKSVRRESRSGRRPAPAPAGPELRVTKPAFRRVCLDAMNVAAFSSTGV
jgi:hypothetical protein